MDGTIRLADDDAPLRRVNHATVSQQIMERVRAALYDGKLRPGDFLGSEKELAETFGVSRMAARDALRALAANGIVDIRVGAGGGIRVAGGDAEKFGEALAIQVALTGASNIEVIEAQLGIEERTAELAAENRTDDDVAELRRLIAAADAARGDARKFLDLGWQFHLAVAEAAHNRVLALQLKALRHVAWASRGSAHVQGVSDKVLAVHSDLADAIAARDTARTKAVMRAHLTNMRVGESQRDLCC